MERLVVSPANGHLPSATESEHGLVGALLIQHRLVGEVAEQVVPEDFDDTRMRVIYTAMVRLWERGVEPNVQTVADELAATGAMDLFDMTPMALVSLQANVSSLRVNGFVSVILDAALRRRVALTGRAIATIAADVDIEAADALDQAKDLVAAIDAPTGVPSEVVDVTTFCAGEDAYDWLVPHLIERGDRLLIVAGEGHGKSVLMRQLAVCCSLGIHPFGGRPYDPMRVLLVDLENPKPLIRRKLRPIAARGRIERPQADHSTLGIVSRTGGIDVTKRADARWLVAQLLAHRPDLLVIGPLYKMFAADDKWEAGARAVTAILDDLRERMNFGLVMETHAPQGQGGGTRHLRPIGSSLWLRWPEFVLTFAPTDHNPKVVQVYLSKDRDERAWPRFLERGGSWPWTACLDENGTKGYVDPQFDSPPWEQEAF